MSRANPRKLDIERAVIAAKACGIDVTAVEVSPDHPSPDGDAQLNGAF